jgi:hypothetical protein
MRKHALIVSALLAASAVGAAAHAAATWRVVASGADSGRHAAVASANASMLEPRRIAVRTTGSGGNVEVAWYFSCNGRVVVPQATTIEVSVSAARTCTLNASGVTERGGSLRLQLLRK